MEVLKVVDRYLLNKSRLVTSSALLTVGFKEDLADHLLTLTTQITGHWKWTLAR